MLLNLYEADCARLTSLSTANGSAKEFFK